MNFIEVLGVDKREAWWADNNECPHWENGECVCDPKGLLPPRRGGPSSVLCGARNKPQTEMCCNWLIANCLQGEALQARKGDMV